jgi:transposase
MVGKGSKIMAIVEGNGLPLGLYIDDARAHEIRYAEPTVRTIKVPQPRGRPRTRPKELIADKAYDSRAFRQSLRKRGIKPTIPQVIRHKPRKPKRGRPLHTGPNFKQRWKIERTFAWFDNCRRLIVRYDRFVEHYRSFCYLAIIIWCLNRLLE